MKRLLFSAMVSLFFAAGSPSVSAAESSGGGLLDGLISALNGAGNERHAEEIITKAFDAELNRKPTSRELDFYKSYVIDDKWTESDIRKDLRRGGSDRAKGGHGSGVDSTFDEATAMVKKAVLSRSSPPRVRA